MIQPSFGESKAQLAKRMLGFYGGWDFLVCSCAMVDRRRSCCARDWGSARNRVDCRDLPKHRIAVRIEADVDQEAFIEHVRAARVDLIVLVSAPQIFQQRLLDAPRHGCINIHNGRLPAYRGMLPNFWQMLNGEAHSITTIHTMVRKLDAGTVVWEEATPIRPEMSLDALIRETKERSADALWRVLSHLAQHRNLPLLRDIEGQGGSFFPEISPRPTTAWARPRAAVMSTRLRMDFVYTVDVEDWYQVENLRSRFPRDVWRQCESRVEEAIRRLLELCEQKEVKGTFSSWAGSRAGIRISSRRLPPAATKLLATASITHLTALDDTAIRRDIAAAKALLEDTAGVRVTGYRAPNFSITNSALEILADLGFEYDLSLFPFAYHDRYGKLDTSQFGEVAANVFQHKDNGLLEFVLPLRRIGRMAVPWAGGGYFRLFPAGLYRAGVRAILERDETFVFYMHPWEIDPGQPHQNNWRVGALPPLRWACGRLSQAGPAARPVRRHDASDRPG